MNKKLMHQEIKKIISKNKTRDKNIYLKILDEVVQLRNGKIKEGEVYINNSTKMIFIDKLGNEFQMTPGNIKSGGWSPYESGLVRDSNYHMKQLNKISLSKGGEIKEGEVYINNSTKMTFIDRLGNEFSMTPSNVKTGKWSPYESGNIHAPSYHMKELNKIALSKGGKIKEGQVYTNSLTKIIFVDNLGNEFKLTPSNVKSGGWSPYESKKVRDPIYHMEELNKIALSKDGKIKEGQVYVNNMTKITFIDKLGNEFKMKSSHIKDGHWSPYESGNVYDINYHMEELKKIAKSRGGRIKDGEIYINSRTKITFIDQLNNEFKITPGNVKSGKWSPFEKNRSEHICRQIVEQIYKNKFPSDYSTLKQSNGNRLQLDGYCKELEIAFEYQGEQHFIGWGNNQEKKNKSLIGIQRRDKEKEIQCKQKNITLLKINYYKELKKPIDLIKQTVESIKQSYINLNLKIPNFLLIFPLEEIKIKFNDISALKKMYEDLEVIVSKNGGKIKEGEVYIDNATKMIFIDVKGNEFSMAPSKIKMGRWSPYENRYIFNNPEYHFKELEKIAREKGGQIKEGEVYVKNKIKMLFIDKFGNEFSACPNNIKNGRWSPYERTKKASKS